MVVLKPHYVPWVNKWTAKGYGYFDTLEDAQKTLERNKKSCQIIVKVSPNEKEELQRLAKIRKTTVANIIRQAIKKEVTNNGRE